VADSRSDRDPDVGFLTAGVLRVARGSRRLPADLTAVVAAVVLTNVAVLAPVVRETPVRVVFGLAFVLFVPGYAFIAALFPEAGEPFDGGDAAETPSSEAGSLPTGGIDGIERVALALGLSIAITPLIGLVLNFTPWGIRLVPILVSLSAFSLGATVVAARRRWALPSDRRFRVPYREWADAARVELVEPDTRADAALNVVLVLSIVVAMSSVGYAVLVPQQGESFSELYLLTETEDGDLVADDYPTEFELGEGRELIVGVGNHEHEQTNYSVVVQLQRIRGENNSTSVVRRDSLAAFDSNVGHNDTWHRRHTVTPTFAGTNLRLQYLLYRGEPPAEPRLENAYRENHLWINVTS